MVALAPLLPLLLVAAILGWVVIGSLGEDSIIQTLIQGVVLIVLAVVLGAVLIAQAGFWSKDSAVGQFAAGLLRIVESAVGPLLDLLTGILDKFVPGGLD